jgi:hypothetical protein
LHLGAKNVGSIMPMYVGPFYSCTPWSRESTNI